MEEIIITTPKPLKLEYTAQIQVGEYTSYITFDCLTEEKTIKITFPEEAELNRFFNSDQLEELKKILWQKTRLEEILNKISSENRAPKNSDFIDLLNREEDIR
ncbi:hypothetical protein [Bacillus cereus]|uniref:hypothetical protein n=1 Tax=Bacillus cereus TaxID=1396 RepID=UPI0007ABF598|nr:hypothetical protein [Bacillus cereus]MCC2396897.1 hypothetical protein [Bacillus cereus]MCU4764505.1 hypothetical protein [Bacillus cereus]MCU5660076.1 hypothetical protein [Bacillus cereus]MCU5720799.1 hypothetical protein [Bacillus cereus]